MPPPQKADDNERGVVERITKIAGLVTALAASVYVMGFVVLASHHRALGLRVQTTDIALLVSEAWAFLYRGSLVVIMNVIQVVGRLPAWLEATALWVLAVSAIALTLGLIIRKRLVDYASRAREWTAPVARRIRKWAAPVVARAGGSVTAGAAVVAILSGVAHFLFNTIPLTSVTSLLSSRDTGLSPFWYLRSGRGIFDWRWKSIQAAIIGDGIASDAQALGGLFTVHFFVVILSVFLLWKLRLLGQDTPSPLRRWGFVLFLVSLVHVAFTPVYYGVLLKSYRYPRAKVLIDGASRDAPELGDYYDHPQFLIAATADELYLYASSRHEVTVIARDKVKLTKVLTDDFLFAKAR